MSASPGNGRRDSHVLTQFLVSTEDMDRLINVNLKGTFFSYKYAAMQLIKQGRGGRLIGAASMASKQGASSRNSMLPDRHLRMGVDVRARL